MESLKPCPFCGGSANLVDHRTDWYVQCKKCKVVVYGETVNHLDHIEDDDEARAAFDAVDWDELKQTAIDSWNARCDNHDRLVEENAALKADRENAISKMSKSWQHKASNHPDLLSRFVDMANRQFEENAELIKENDKVITIMRILADEDNFTVSQYRRAKREARKLIELAKHK